MTEVLTLMLLVYPGALVDVFYKLIAPERFDDDDTPDVMRMARYFIYSGLIAVIALWILSICWTAQGKLVENGIYGALNLIKAEWNSIWYVILTTVIALIFAFIHKLLIDKLSNKLLASTPKSMEVLACRDPWQEVTHSKRYEWTDTICAIYENGKLLTSGIVSALPADIIKSPAISLDCSEFVSQVILDDKERGSNDKYIGHLMVEYFMLDTGRTIKFYKAPRLIKYLGDYYNSTSD